MRHLAVGLLALVCAQGCSMHRRSTASPAGYRPSQQMTGTSIEAHDPRLAAALLALQIAPSSARHRAAADEYRRLGILDTAFDHLTAATHLNPQDAAAYDARARIWREWGFAHLGLGDAARAVYYAPHSAAAHNTWGTLLAATGDDVGARREFERALALEPGATFALTNLCVLDQRAGDGPATTDACREVSAIAALTRSSR